MTRLPASGAEFAEALDRLAAGERVILERDGESVAALVTLDELRQLAELEDLEGLADVEAMREARVEMERTGERPRPFDEVCGELGID